MVPNLKILDPSFKYTLMDVNNLWARTNIYSAV